MKSKVLEVAANAICGTDGKMRLKINRAATRMENKRDL
ncbi:hypothetical protein CDSM653_00342 [Caldanaerobacter subterraneus subsp. pacificus DSM 12653]|uniref:Uncharacterized protein n=1 Tax=Caldanaerobacter subterraneus subsp. pacificus DSM 12653 TaxID=391606 RepID=A0A0F5PPQ7_9THEO|nr:hypothetical protein CDSM653_00342 [Caldanaerobacter subterraneus subsp. pacificus DSM 12653]